MYIIDKYPPPGEGDDHRLVVVIGKCEQVRLCKAKIDQVLERAREELPPLPPPLTSGWRPLPTVGPSDESETYVVNLPPGSKRPREDDEYGGGPPSAMPPQGLPIPA